MTRPLSLRTPMFLRPTRLLAVGRAVWAALNWHRAVRTHLRDDNERAAALLGRVEHDLRGMSGLKAVLFRAKVKHASGGYAQAADDYRRALASLEHAGDRIAPNDFGCLKLYASICCAVADRMRGEGRDAVQWRTGRASAHQAVGRCGGSVPSARRWRARASLMDHRKPERLLARAFAPAECVCEVA